MTTPAGDRLAVVSVVSATDVLVVRLDGEIDVGNVARVAGDVRRAALQATTIVVDLSNLRYAGSAAMRMLETEGTAMVQRGARCLLMAPASGSTRRLLGIVGLDRTFPVIASLNDVPRLLAS
jgi:anti-anti-sigma factor